MNVELPKQINSNVTNDTGSIIQRDDEREEGEFIETIFAAYNQLDRRKNQKRVIDRMAARFMNGYYPLPSYPKCFKRSGKDLVHTKQAVYYTKAFGRICL